MIASSDVINAFPELAAVAGSTWTWAIAEAYAELSVDALGTNLDRAAVFLAAHYAQLATSSLVHGIVTEEHVGSVGRALAGTRDVDSDDYSRTLYGLMFKRFVRKTVDYWCVG